jgi:hypothetical protein
MIQECIDSLENILSLPMVLLHQNLGMMNILVDGLSGELTGFTGWTDTAIGPFGMNLHAIDFVTGHFHLKNGWERFRDRDLTQEIFWNTLKDEVGGIPAETIETIKTARMMGLLISHGFVDAAKTIPIGDDAIGRYHKLWLDGLLVSPETRYENLP